MSKLFVACATAVVAVSAGACAPANEPEGQGAASEESDVAAIIALNREQQNELLLHNNAEPMERVTLDNYLVIAPGGRVETKAQAVAGVDSLDVQGVEFSKEQVIFYGDTAVLVGRIDIDGTMQPLGKLPPMKFMSTYVRTSDGWRALARSMTPCAPIAVERGVC